MGTKNPKSPKMISTTKDTSEIDTHQCELEQIGPDRGARTKYRCKHCGTVTRPAKGVKKAKRQRRW